MLYKQGSLINYKTNAHVQYLYEANRFIFLKSLLKFRFYVFKQFHLGSLHFFIFQETITANGGNSAVDLFGNGLVDGRELDLSTSVTNHRHYKYISLILAAVALFFLSLCVAAFLSWRRYVKLHYHINIKLYIVIYII